MCLVRGIMWCREVQKITNKSLDDFINTATTLHDKTLFALPAFQEIWTCDVCGTNVSVTWGEQVIWQHFILDLLKKESVELGC